MRCMRWVIFLGALFIMGGLLLIFLEVSLPVESLPIWLFAIGALVVIGGVVLSYIGKK